MKVQYIFEKQDDKLRAESLLLALYDVAEINSETHLGDVVVTISDKTPAYYVFDAEITRHGNIGWRQAAKSISEKFFGYKLDVADVSELAEKYYQASKENKADTNLPEQVGGVFMPNAIPATKSKSFLDKYIK